MAETARPGLAHQAVRGVAALAVSQLSRLLLQIASVVVLTRLLMPGDFGLFAMAVTVIGVGELLRELGLSAAAIQAKSLSIRQRDNLFWLNSGAGAVIALAVAALAPLLGAAYGQPEVSDIALALAPTFFMSGLAAQFRAGLIRDLRFKAVAATEIVSSTIALGVGVWLAVEGAGVWALVAQQLAGGLLFLIGYVVAARWRPGRYRRGEPMRGLIGFGSQVLASQLLTYVTLNFDSVVIGARLGAENLGLYNRGLQLIRTPLNLVRAPVVSVGMPVLSKLQDDPKRFMAFAERAQLAMCYPILAAIGLFVATAEDAVALALGPQWADAVPLMQAIAVGEAVSTLMTIASLLLIAQGQGRQLVGLSAWALVVRVVFVLAALPWGVLGVAIAYALAPLTVMPYVLWRVGRVTGLDPRPLAVQAARISLVVGLASAATYAVSHALPSSTVPLLVLSVGLVTQVLALLALALVPVVRRDYQDALRTITMLRRRDRAVVA